MVAPGDSRDDECDERDQGDGRELLAGSPATRSRDGRQLLDPGTGFVHQIRQRVCAGFDHCFQGIRHLLLAFDLLLPRWYLAKRGSSGAKGVPRSVAGQSRRRIILGRQASEARFDKVTPSWVNE